MALRAGETMEDLERLAAEVNVRHWPSNSGPTQRSLSVVAASPGSPTAGSLVAWEPDGGYRDV